jgi:hypothetical protein
MAKRKKTFAELHDCYVRYVEEIKNKWMSVQRNSFRDVFEVMSPTERERLDKTPIEWAAYITPLAEAWWKKHGYEIIWPAKNTDPTQFRPISRKP